MFIWGQSTFFGTYIHSTIWHVHIKNIKRDIDLYVNVCHFRENKRDDLSIKHSRREI